MARTKGAKDKAPRKHRDGTVPGVSVVTTEAKKKGCPLTVMVEIEPSDELLFRDGVHPRAAYISADSPGLYTVHMEVYVKGEWIKVKQKFAVVEQTHDVLGEPFEEPFLTSPVFPIHIRRVIKEGTNAPHVMVLY